MGHPKTFSALASFVQACSEPQPDAFENIVRRAKDALGFQQGTEFCVRLFPRVNAFRSQPIQTDMSDVVPYGAARSHTPTWSQRVASITESSVRTNFPHPLALPVLTAR
jgi:hypothetical protein